MAMTGNRTGRPTNGAIPPPRRGDHSQPGQSPFKSDDWSPFSQWNSMAISVTGRLPACFGCA